jgi:hypothetical protein
MKTSFIAFVATLTAMCSLAPPSYGQYPMMPGYQMPAQAGGYAPAMMGAQPGMAMQAVPILTSPPPGSFVAPAGLFGGDPSCDVGCMGKVSSCDGRCGGGCADCCQSSGGFDHCWYFYGEFLYLRARDSEVAWAAPIDGPIIGPPPGNPIQIQPLGVADMDFQPGFRFGFQYNSSECTGISAQYTMYEASTNDAVNVAAPNVIRSLVSHPGTATAAQDFVTGAAAYNINYDIVDIDYRKLMWYDHDYQFGYLAGIGIVQMEQTFLANFAGAGTEQVQTDIDFYGAGARFGLFGEFQMNDRWRIYGKGIGNLIAGEFRADYDQRQSFDPQVVDTFWHGGRIVGIWDLETGFKWTSRCGNYSANLGYVFSAWTNTLQTDEWIRGVRENTFIGMDNTMTFDGLVVRFEARF